jgi:hypothetical protein
MTTIFRKEAQAYAKTRDGFVFSFRLVHQWQDSVLGAVQVDVTDYTAAARNYTVVGSALPCRFSADAQVGTTLEAADVIHSAGRRYLRLHYQTWTHPAGSAKVFSIQFNGTAVRM